LRSSGDFKPTQTPLVCIFFRKLIQNAIKKITGQSENIHCGESSSQVRVFDLIINKGSSKVKEVDEIDRSK
jgi:hypothetical protein